MKQPGHTAWHFTTMHCLTQSIGLPGLLSHPYLCTALKSGRWKQRGPSWRFTSHAVSDNDKQFIVGQWQTTHLSETFVCAETVGWAGQACFLLPLLPERGSELAKCPRTVCLLLRGKPSPQSWHRQPERGRGPAQTQVSTGEYPLLSHSLMTSKKELYTAQHGIAAPWVLGWGFKNFASLTWLIHAEWAYS